MRRILVALIAISAITTLSRAQEESGENTEISSKEARESKNYTYEANKELTQNDFVNAEANYRRAISKNKENTSAPYNLGRAYYNRESYAEAFSRFKEAGEQTREKPTKHKSYHNMGNVFMNNKEYQKAVEAYKEALRNNPKDEE
ncbi:MAG: tetratricopeptide repeat protein, partial [Bacteroidota bacterium]